MLRGMQGSGNMNEMQQQMMNNPELMNQLMSSPHVQNAMQVRNFSCFLLAEENIDMISYLGFNGQSRIITTNDKIESSNESDYGTESRNSTHV